MSTAQMNACQLVVGEEPHHLCLTAPSAMALETLRLLPRPANTDSSVAFQFHPSVDGAFHIVHAASGLVLDVAEFKWQHQPKIILFARNEPASKNQLWRLEADGSIRSVLKPSHCLTFACIEEKANLVLAPCEQPKPASGQRFRAVVDPSAPRMESEMEPEPASEASPSGKVKAKFRHGVQSPEKMEKWDAATVEEFLLFIGLKAERARVFAQEGICGFQLLRLPDALLLGELGLQRLDLARLKMYLPAASAPAPPAADASEGERHKCSAAVFDTCAGSLLVGARVVLRSVATGRSLRIDKDGKVCGNGGRGKWAQFVVMPGRDVGHVRLQNVGCPQHYVAIREGQLCHGAGGPFCELAPVWQRNDAGTPLVSLRAVAEPGGVGVLPSGDPKPARLTGHGPHGQFTVHIIV